MINEKKNDTITWLQVHNLVPILTAVISAALSFAALNTRLSVMESKIELVLINQEKELARNYDREVRYGNLSNRITTIEALISKK